MRPSSLDDWVGTQLVYTRGGGATGQGCRGGSGRSFGLPSRSGLCKHGNRVCLVPRSCDVEDAEERRKYFAYWTWRCYDAARPAGVGQEAAGSVAGGAWSSSGGVYMPPGSPGYDPNSDPGHAGAGSGSSVAGCSQVGSGLTNRVLKIRGEMVNARRKRRRRARAQVVARVRGGRAQRGSDSSSLSSGSRDCESVPGSSGTDSVVTAVVQTRQQALAASLVALAAQVALTDVDVDAVCMAWMGQNGILPVGQVGTTAAAQAKEGAANVEVLEPPKGKRPLTLNLCPTELTRRVDKVAIPLTMVDSELYHHLAVESMFEVRAPEMALVLKRKAVKFLDNYDCSKLAGQVRYELIHRAVAAAMVPKVEELDVRHVYRAGVKRMHAHADLVRGDVSAQGLVETVGDWFVGRPDALPAAI